MKQVIKQLSAGQVAQNMGKKRWTHFYILCDLADFDLLG